MNDEEFEHVLITNCTIRKVVMRIIHHTRWIIRIIDSLIAGTYHGWEGGTFPAHLTIIIRPGNHIPVFSVSKMDGNNEGV